MVRDSSMSKDKLSREAIVPCSSNLSWACKASSNASSGPTSATGSSRGPAWADLCSDNSDTESLSLTPWGPCRDPLEKLEQPAPSFQDEAGIALSLENCLSEAHALQEMVGHISQLLGPAAGELRSPRLKKGRDATAMTEVGSDEIGAWEAIHAELVTREAALIRLREEQMEALSLKAVAEIEAKERSTTQDLPPPGVKVTRQEVDILRKSNTALRDEVSRLRTEMGQLHTSHNAKVASLEAEVERLERTNKALYDSRKKRDDGLLAGLEELKRRLSHQLEGELAAGQDSERKVRLELEAVQKRLVQVAHAEDSLLENGHSVAASTRNAEELRVSENYAAEESRQLEAKAAAQEASLLRMRDELRRNQQRCRELEVLLGKHDDA